MSALSFNRSMERFLSMARARYDLLFDRCNEHVGRSIVFGSATTGAPGQPVKSGRLIGGWHEQRSGRYNIRWVNYVPYARIIEDNFRGATLRSRVGGFHSVKYTRAGWKNIVAYELAIVKAAIPDGGKGGFSRDAGGSWRDARGRYTSRPGGA